VGGQTGGVYFEVCCAKTCERRAVHLGHLWAGSLTAGNEAIEDHPGSLRGLVVKGGATARRGLIWVFICLVLVSRA
jgi:hypothetical protein